MRKLICGLSFTFIVLGILTFETPAQCGADGTQACPPSKKTTKKTITPKSSIKKTDNVTKSTKKTKVEQKSSVDEDVPKYLIDSDTMSLITPDGFEFQFSFNDPLWEDRSYLSSPFGKKKEHIAIVFKYKNLILDRSEMAVVPVTFFKGKKNDTGFGYELLRQSSGKGSLVAGIAEENKLPKCDEIRFEFSIYEGWIKKFILIYHFKKP